MATFSSENLIVSGLELFSWGRIKEDETKNFIAQLMQLAYSNNISSFPTLFSQLTDWSNSSIYSNTAVKKTFDEFINRGLSNLDNYFYYNGAAHLVADFKSSPCSKLYKKASDFLSLLSLINVAENNLINDAEVNNLEDRIQYLRGIYYGTIWSLDFKEQKSKIRNYLFNRFCDPLLLGFNTPNDPRPYFQCNLFKAFFESPEVINNDGRRIDWGHVITGMESRTHSSAISGNISIVPASSITFGGTGLECNTWLGDLGGGAGTVARRRVDDPNYRAINVFSVYGHSFGSAINLEGDIASYIIARDISTNDVSLLSYSANDTIFSLLQSYLGDSQPSSEWLNRAKNFLIMLGGTISNGTLSNRNVLVNSLATKIETFGSFYALNDILKKYNFDTNNQQAQNLIHSTALHIKGASIEVAAIFIDGLIYSVNNPNSMISRRTNPSPTPAAQTGSSILESIYTGLSWADYFTESSKDHAQDMLNRLKNIFENEF